MTREEPWYIIRQASAENKHELVLSGAAISELIKKEGLDASLFDLVHLNFLNITQTCLAEIPDEIEKLKNLTNLVLHSNEISKLPHTIDKLEKLKFLDCSRNKLAAVPTEIGNLPNLYCLNLASNLLTSLPAQIQNVKLSVLNLSNNQFEVFPDVCYSDLVHLSELQLNGNKIKEIPVTISQLTSLKILNLADNSISVIPGEITDCTKLKELHLKGNPLTDKRLSKLVDQCRTKQVLEYVKQHCPRTTSLSNSAKSKKGKKAQKISDSENIATEIDDITGVLEVLKLAPETPVIKLTKHINNIRPYIVACIVKNLAFTDETFKKFIQLQTKLHETICLKRNAATIATHDLKLIGPGDLTYTAMNPNDFEIKPLMRKDSLTGAKLFKLLQTEADNLRKEKKSNVYSGVHKYLYLLEGKPLYPCLLNASEQVISFPPITNSDITKMSVTTESMLIEVTSPNSFQICRNVLDQLLEEMITLNLGSKPGQDDMPHPRLTIEQVKVVDPEGNMKLVYPSRADLHCDSKISVLRHLR